MEWKGTDICCPTITPASTRGCATQRQKPHAKKLSPTSFADGFQLTERKGRSWLISEGLVGTSGRKEEAWEVSRELENGIWKGAEEHCAPILQTRLKTLEFLQPPELRTWLMGCDVSPPMALIEPYCSYKLPLIAQRHNAAIPGLNATNSQTQSQLPSTFSIAAFCTAHICICLISSLQLN